MGETDNDGLMTLKMKNTLQKSTVYKTAMSPTMQTFKKNKLSVDPETFPASKLEAMSTIQMKTLEKEIPH